MSAWPATCSAALEVVALVPESMDADTMTAWECCTHVVGADTLFTTGPCCKHLALWHTSPMPHLGSQGSAQTLRPVSHTAGAMHPESSVQAPVGETEHAARIPQARQAANSRLIEALLTLEDEGSGETGGEQHTAHREEDVGGGGGALGRVDGRQVALEVAAVQLVVVVGLVHQTFAVQALVHADAGGEDARGGHAVAHGLLPAAFLNVHAGVGPGTVQLRGEPERKAALLGLAREDGLGEAAAAHRHLLLQRGALPHRQSHGVHARLDRDGLRRLEGARRQPVV